MKTRTRLLLFLGALALATGSWAQEFPSRPLRFVVPYPPGGSLDVVARAMAPKLSAALGQPVVIDNRAGASGTIGSEFVARAAPDGYTFGIASPASHSVPVALGKKLPYDPVKDFTPLALLVKNPLVIVVNASLPVKTLKELGEYGRQHPGTLSFGTSGEGSTQHMEGLKFNRLAGIEMLHVPYKGGGLALTDLLGGQIQVGFQTIPTVFQHIKAGKLRALAVLDTERYKALPDVPTHREAWAGYDARMSWILAVGPAGMPPAIAERLSREMIKALNDPEVRGDLEANGQPVVAERGPKVERLLRDDIAYWKTVARDAKLKVD